MIMEWQPIETASKDRLTEILLWFPFGTPGLSKPGCYFIGIWGYPNEKAEEAGWEGPCWVDPNESEPLGEPTHWMPLPEPPAPPGQP